jgi:serine/threonine protein kinase
MHFTLSSRWGAVFLTVEECTKVCNPTPPTHSIKPGAPMANASTASCNLRETVKLRCQETTLGGYRLIRELGRGGMGVVYLGEHKHIGRPAAIKLLLPHFSMDPATSHRFINEARAAAAIRHPGIVEIYDFDVTAQGQAFIVMECLEGETLGARLQRLRVLPVMTALTIARQIARALAAAHRQGVLHRDLKPDNIFIVPDAEVPTGERAKLLDFGIAKFLGPAMIGKGPTILGMVLGTPTYMSPEQCLGSKDIDHRSDLYALGCLLFEMLCGQPPFPGECSADVVAGHCRLPTPSPQKLSAWLPDSVDRLVVRLLAKDPSDRPRDAQCVASTLHEIMVPLKSSPRAPTLRRHVLLGAATMALLAVASVAGLSQCNRDSKSLGASRTSGPSDHQRTCSLFPPVLTAKQ